MIAIIAERIAIAFAGYAAACWVAGLVIGRLTLLLVPQQLGGITEDTHTSNMPLTEGSIVGVAVAIIMLIPAVITVAIAELMAIRNIAYYGFSGAFWGMLLEALITRKLDMFLVIFGLSGAIAGVVYWIIAGRGAGRGGAGRPDSARD